jgi:hypothetical protein
MVFETRLVFTDEENNATAWMPCFIEEPTAEHEKHIYALLTFEEGEQHTVIIKADHWQMEFRRKPEDNEILIEL